MAPRTRMRARMRVAYKNLWEMFAMPIYRFLGLPLKYWNTMLFVTSLLSAHERRIGDVLDCFIDVASFFYDTDVSYPKFDVFYNYFQ